MVWDFISKYYVDPIIQGQAYTIVDTLTYAVILIAAVWLVWRWLRHAGIVIDHGFVLATIPYVVLGGLLRVVEDTGIIPAPWYVLLVTPLIFFVIFFYAIIALVCSRALEQHGLISSYKKGYAGAGIFAAAVSALVLLCAGAGIIEMPGHEPVIALWVLAAILSLALATSAVLWGLLRYLAGWDFVSDIMYRLLIFGHMLDASATSIGIDIHPVPYVEQHVVGSALIDATGTAFAMFPLKLAVVVPAIYILEMYRKEGNSELWHLIVLAMIMVGMAPGIRDMVRMVLYV
jgi:uncharacterized membrane protein